MAVNQQVDRDPFPRGCPDGYFFTTPALRLRLDLLREHITRGDSPVLLVGASGAGKTTLLHQLVTRADSAWRIVCIPAVASFSTEEFATLIGEQLGVGFHNSVTTGISTAGPAEPTIAHRRSGAARQSCASPPGAGAPCRRSDAALGRLLFSLAVLPRLWQGGR